MSISMQGAWYVRVKSKSAGFAQRFIVSGASTGNGVRVGSTSTPEVFVNGNSWNIRIQNDPGSGFLNSTLKLTYPRIVGGEYVFDLQSNDAGSDEDFNDLILTFRTPVTDSDYVVYGNISYYKGCLFNPCHRFLVLDTYLKFREAIINPSIRAAVKSYYPSLDRVAFNPQPEPPATFKPLAIPFSGKAIPDREQVITVGKPNEISVKADKKQEVEATQYSYNALKSSRVSSLQTTDSLQASKLSTIQGIELAKISDRLRLFCETGPIPFAQIQFNEYDRSNQELLGAPYTGDGNSEDLGKINADSFGNYIFRFSRSLSDTLNEVDVDVAPGEEISTQFRPDLVMQLKDPFSENGTLFETAPYWNIPFLRRINLCIPKEKAGLVPSACSGLHILQGVGNIAMAAMNGSGNRVGGGNSLNNSGIVTSKADIAPSTRCAAFSGSLLLKGCLDNPNIKYYTLERRNRDLFESWQPFTQPLRLAKNIGSSTVQSLVNRSFGPGNTIEGYLNVEVDGGNWLPGYDNIKARIVTSAFDNARHSFRIQGYDASGNAISGTSEVIHLYLQDAKTTAAIDPVINFGGDDLGDCALFQLPTIGGTVVEDAPMTVRFKVEHNPNALPPRGFMNEYALTVHKGSTGGFGVNLPVVDAIFSGSSLIPEVNRGRKYAHTSDLECTTVFKGTVNEVSADGDGYYTAILQPSSGGWLDPEQSFCAFSINLNGTLRLTNGSSGYPDFHATSILIGIERPDA